MVVKVNWNGLFKKYGLKLPHLNITPFNQYKKDRAYQNPDFEPLLQGGRVIEKSLCVGTLQAAEPPYSVITSPMK